MSEAAPAASATAAPPYEWENQALTPSGAMPLIKEVLANEKKPLDRAEICKRIQRLHLSRGGAPTPNLPQRAKKALSYLRDSGEAVMVGFRRYITGQPSDIAQSDSDSQLSDMEADENDDFEATAPDIRLKPEIEIGSGSEKVYVYFVDTERTLAHYEKRNCWPCKVGYTSTTVDDRIIGQAATAMYRLPTVGLVIHTDKGRLLEKLIHCALFLTGREVVGALGAEWFNTSPEAIREWYEAFFATLPLLRDDNPINPSESANTQRGAQLDRPVRSPAPD